MLISGIGGGVALTAAQFCAAAGAEVWVTSGDDDKLARALALEPELLELQDEMENVARQARRILSMP